MSKTERLPNQSETADKSTAIDTHAAELTLDTFLIPEEGSIDKQRIDLILNNEPLGHDSATERALLFPVVYKSANKLSTKYRIAWSLIEDERYAEMSIQDGRQPQSGVEFLLNNFLPTAPDQKAQVDELYTEDEQGELQGSLELLCVRKGLIDLSQQEAEPVAERAADRLIQLIERREELSYINEFLTDEEAFNAQLILLRPEDMDDEQFEQVRSWATNRRFLREHLGTLKTYRPKGDIPILDYWEAQPDKVFEDRQSAAYVYAREMVKKRLRKEFANGQITHGLKTLEDLIAQETQPNKQRFLENTQTEFQNILAQEIPQRFVTELPGWLSDEPSPFPLFHQMQFMHEFAQTRRMAFFGDTGSTKTACSYLAMENLKREKVTIIGPAQARDTWGEQAETLFENDQAPDVFLVEGIKDLSDKRMASAQYVYVGTELMRRAEKDAELMNLLETALLKTRKTDAVILEEAHVLRNEATATAKVASYFVSEMRDKYEAETEETMPMVALTATPIGKGLKDLNVIMGLLYPDRFQMPFGQGARKTFTSFVEHNPYNAHRLLIGEKRIFQLGLDDVFGDQAPPFEYERILLPLTAHQRILLDWVRDQPFGALDKIRYMGDIMLSPNLFVEMLKRDKKEPKVEHNEAELFSEFDACHTEWMRTHGTEHELPWSEEYIALYHPEIYMAFKFSPELDSRFSSLLLNSQRQLRSDWVEADYPSPKIEYINSLVSEDIRLAVFSPERKKGVTRETALAEEIDVDALSLVDYLKIGNQTVADQIVGVDGDMPFSERRSIAKQFGVNPDGPYALVASLPSVNVSIRMSVEDIGVLEALGVFIGPPATYERLKQGVGRILRPGLQVPTRLVILEGEGTVDQGRYNNILTQELATNILFSGIRISKEQMDLVLGKKSAENKANRNVLEAADWRKHLFVRDIMAKMPGQGEEELIRQLERTHDGKSLYEFFSDVYFDMAQDEFRSVGHNAELIKNLVIQHEPEQVVSVGAGTCLFARKLNQARYQATVDNLDINPSALAIAKHHYPDIGTTIEARATALPQEDATYDAVECSYMLDWSKLYDDDMAMEIHTPTDEIERVRMLSEIHRVLKINGVATFSFPEKTFDSEHYDQFTQALSHFGFELLPNSGMSYSVDRTPRRRIGWVMQVRKIGDIQLDTLDPYMLAMSSDMRVVISKYDPAKKVRERPLPEATTIDYHIPTEFQIVDPTTGVSTESKSTDEPGSQIASKTEEQTVFIHPEDIVSHVKQSMTPNQYRTMYRPLVRSIQTELEIEYTAAEALICQAIYTQATSGVLLDTIFEKPDDIFRNALKLEKPQRNGTIQGK